MRIDTGQHQRREVPEPRLAMQDKTPDQFARKRDRSLEPCASRAGLDGAAEDLQSSQRVDHPAFHRRTLFCHSVLDRALSIDD